MRFSVSYNTAFFGVDPDDLLGYAQHAEQCGFEGIYLAEHIALYQGAEVSGFPLPPDLPYADPLDSLAFIAAGTERLLLGTGVLLLPYHHPVTLAKRMATVDQLSRGRLRLVTIGLGALPGEAAAVGVDYRSRGRRADEALAVLRGLWSGEEFSFRGEFFDFDGLTSFPKPYAGSIPLHVGGSSRAAARRAGRLGDGFFPGGALLPAERIAQLDLARATAEQSGRDPYALSYTRMAPIDVTEARLAAYREQGVDRVVVSATGATAAERTAELTAFADRMGLR